MLKEFDHEAEEKENVIHDRMYLAENIIEMLINTTDLYVPVMLIESDKKLESRI